MYVLAYQLLLYYTPPNFVCGGYTVFTFSVLASVRPSVCSSVYPSVTFCFLNIFKSHCWNFIKPCKHVHIYKVSKGAKIRNPYNQVPHLTQDTNGKVTNSQLDTTNKSQEVSPFPAGDNKAHINRRVQRHSKQVLLLEQVLFFLF